MSRTPLVATTVTTLLAGSVPGLNVTVRLSAEMLTPMPSDTPLPDNNAKVLLFTVFGLSDLENVSTTVGFNPTFVEPSAGVTASTCGEVISVAAPMVNELKKKFTPLPAKSCSGP